MKRTLLALVAAAVVGAWAGGALIYGSCSCSCAVAHSELIEAESYPTPDAAAIAALARAMAQSDLYEYGGSIIERGGRYYITEPVTSRNTTRVRWTFRVPADGRLVAFYHTHPCDGGDNPSLFSALDVNTARKHGVLSYIGVVCTREVRRYDPRTTPRMYLKDRRTFGRVARGELIYRFEEPV